MATSFDVTPANPLAALMAGVQGYDRGAASAKENEIRAGRQDAMAALQAGADPSNALSRLIGVGDIQGATVLAKLHETQNAQNGVYGTPIYGQGPGGETQIGTFDKKGQFRQIQTGGFTPTLPVKPLDTGTGFVMTPGRAPFVGGQPSGPARGPQPQLDINSEGIPPSQAARVNGPQTPSNVVEQRFPQTLPPAVPGYIPKDVRGRKREEEIGQAQGQAQVDLPRVIDNANFMLKNIDELRNHPGRDWATGPIAGRVPAVGGAQADYIERLQQIQGQTFLEAFNSLRGGGQITEAEGNKATVALARLNRVKDTKSINQALDDLRSVIEAGMRRASIKAGNAVSSAPQSPQQPQNSTSQPPLPNARQAPDGNWYVEQNGRYFRVDQQ